METWYTCFYVNGVRGRVVRKRSIHDELQGFLKHVDSLTRLNKL